MSEVKLDPPNGSHWLATEYQRGGEISKEELYPVAVLTVLRVGEVRAKFSVDRYRFADGDWTDWRIYVREVEPSRGIGEATLKLIREKAEPVIREWLASGDYLASRELAARSMVKRMIRESDVPFYGPENARSQLQRYVHELSPGASKRYELAIEHLEKAGRLLDD